MGSSIVMWSIETLVSLVQTSDTAIAILNRNGDIVAMNPAWDGVAARHGGDLIHHRIGANALNESDDAPARQAAAGAAEVRAGNRPNFSMVYPCTVSGENHWYRLSVRALPGTDGTFAMILTDVTAPYSTEILARRLEHRYASFIEHALDLITVIDADGVIVYQSPAVTEILGYPTSEVIGQDSMAFVFPDDRETMQEAIRQVLEQPYGSRTVEIRMPHQDGSLRWLETRLTNMVQDGAINGIVVNSRDITDRKQALVQLAEREQTLRLALEAGRMAVWDWEVGSHLISWDGLEHHAIPEGWDPGAFDTDFILSLPSVHPDDRDNLIQLNQEFERHGWQLWESEYRMMTATGGVRWLYDRGIGVEHDDQGQVRRMVGITMDIHDRKMNEAKLAEQAESFQTLFQSTVEGMVVHDDGRCVAVNDQFAAMAGADAETLVGRELLDFVAPEMHQELLEQELLGLSKPYEFIALNADGERVPVEMLERPIRYQGRLLRLLTVRDISERRALEDAVRASEARFRALVQEASDIVIVYSDDGQLQYANPALGRILGYSIADMSGEMRFDLVHPDDLNVITRAVDALRTDRDAQLGMACRVRRADGTWVWLEGMATNHLDDPAVRGIVLNLRDISEHKRLEADLRHHALHDPLTSLPNRALLADRLKYALLQAAERRDRVAVFFIDLDFFKQVNDAYSHAAGDALLRAVAGRLSSALDPSATVSRIGGDEFIVLMPRVENEREAMDVAERLQSVMKTPFRWNDRDVLVSLSIGIAVSGAGIERSEDLMRAADAALYSAKRGGRARAMLYASGMGDNAGRQLALESDLREAARQGQFTLHYQPIIDLTTGEVNEVEALLRWQHPIYGQVSPEEFIPLAESTGQIVAIGCWVLAEVARQRLEWGPDAPAVAVNLSATQFAAPEIVKDLTALVGKSSPHRGKIHVEITEHTLVEDLQATIRTLDHLRSIGTLVAIDDFGTGYSSLRYLRDLPVDTIKLDQSFVRGLESDPGALAVVEGITSLAHTMGLLVTAEGIETAEQLDRLREIGCDRGQGFHIARPAPARSTPPGPTIPIALQNAL